MALVRRDNVVGQAAQLIGVAQPPVTGRAPVHAVPVQAPSPAQSGDPGAAAAVPSQPASFGAIVGAFALVALGAAGSWVMWQSGHRTAPIQMQDTTTLFAVLFAFATAVERLLEPFSRFMPGQNGKAEVELAIAAMANQGHTYESLTRVAAAKARMERGRSSRALVTWGFATALATVGSSAGGFYLLHSIAGTGWNGIQTWVDAIVTGIVVGSGTKPLHDVISRMQKAKESAEDPAR
jgi:hypothetical protein